MGTNFRTTWQRPHNSLNETVGDTRTLSYRVWRSPAGAETWTELTTSRLGDSATSYDDPILIEGQPFEYLVQAWDPGTGTGYGEWRKSGSVSVPAADPVLTLAAPATGFTVGTGPVSVSGTASDTGSGVDSVDIRVRRADGLCWNGVSWTSVDTWLPVGTHAPDWSTWSHIWTPDDLTAASPQPITISARATDRSGRVSSRSAQSAWSSAILLDGGAAFTEQNPIPVEVTASGSPDIRFKVDGVADGRGWMPYAHSTTVSVPAEGAHTVVCEFSFDNGARSGHQQATRSRSTLSAQRGADVANRWLLARKRGCRHRGHRFGLRLRRVSDECPHQALGR